MTETYLILQWWNEKDNGSGYPGWETITEEVPSDKYDSVAHWKSVHAKPENKQKWRIIKRTDELIAIHNQ